ncbi:MAG: TonB C-terminal domain-containing protein [Steroidobacteraceae bacterium]
MSEKSQKLRFVPALGLLAILVVAGGLLIWALRAWMSSAPPKTKQVVQEIRLIRPPPPPPEPPPPPPPKDEQLPEPEPESTPDMEPPPGEQLGVDAEGTAGGDGFGLVARPGGRDLLGNRSSAFVWYAGLIRNEILNELNEEQRARMGSYSVQIKIWVRQDGTVERIELTKPSGDRDRDRAIEGALAKIDRISQGPPADMPQPVSLRIVSRA